MATSIEMTPNISKKDDDTKEDVETVFSYLTNINDIITISSQDPTFIPIIEKQLYEDIEIPYVKSLFINLISEKSVKIGRFVLDGQYENDVRNIILSHYNHVFQIVVVFPSEAIIENSFEKFSKLLQSILDYLPFVDIFEFDCILASSIFIKLIGTLKCDKIRSVVCMAVKFEPIYGEEGKTWFKAFPNLEILSLIPCASHSLVFIYYLKEGLGDRMLKMIKFPEVLWSTDKEKHTICEVLEFSMNVFEGIALTISLFSHCALHTLSKMISKLRFIELDIIFCRKTEIDLLATYFHKINISKLTTFRIYAANPRNYSFTQSFFPIFEKLNEAQYLRTVTLAEIKLSEFLDEFETSIYILKSTTDTLYQSCLGLIPKHIKCLEFKGQPLTSTDFELLIEHFPDIEQLSFSQHTILSPDFFDNFKKIKELKFYCSQTEFSKLPESLEIMTCICCCDFLSETDDPTHEKACWTLGIKEDTFSKSFFYHDEITDATVIFYGNSFFDLHKRMYSLEPNLDWIVENLTYNFDKQDNSICNFVFQAFF
uniref:F-box domain-containing protein n=1 Tax=Rhabditophanes sp. KR3021 TaxID=114890 RepID=A0AC35TKE7_9BILA